MFDVWKVNSYRGLSGMIYPVAAVSLKGLIFNPFLSF